MAKLTQLVLIAVLGISFCFAQVNRGTLTGVITDPSGAVVPGVKITATHVETGTSFDHCSFRKRKLHDPSSPNRFVPYRVRSPQL